MRQAEACRLESRTGFSLSCISDRLKMCAHSACECGRNGKLKLALLGGDRKHLAQALAPKSTGREPGGCGGAGPLVSAVLDGDDESFAECIGQASEG